MVFNAMDGLRATDYLSRNPTNQNVSSDMQGTLVYYTYTTIPYLHFLAKLNQRPVQHTNAFIASHQSLGILLLARLLHQIRGR